MNEITDETMTIILPDPAGSDKEVEFLYEDFDAPTITEITEAS